MNNSKESKEVYFFRKVEVNRSSKGILLVFSNSSAFLVRLDNVSDS